MAHYQTGNIATRLRNNINNFEGRIAVPTRMDIYRGTRLLLSMRRRVLCRLALRVAQVLYNDAEVCEEDAFFAWQDDTAEEVSSKQITHA